jgi:hypothetical protein
LKLLNEKFAFDCCQLKDIFIDVVSQYFIGYLSCAFNMIFVISGGEVSGLGVKYQMLSGFGFGH